MKNLTLQKKFEREVNLKRNSRNSMSVPTLPSFKSCRIDDSHVIKAVVPLASREEHKFLSILTPDSQARDPEYKLMKQGIKPLFPYVTLDKASTAPDSRMENGQGWMLMYKALNLQNPTDRKCTLIRALDQLEDFRVRQKNLELALQYGLKLTKNGEPDST